MLNHANHANSIKHTLASKHSIKRCVPSAIVQTASSSASYLIQTHLHGNIHPSPILADNDFTFSLSRSTSILNRSFSRIASA